MLIQAAGLALLAALSPTALLVAAVYLGSARPRLVTAFYLAGAVLMSLVMGVCDEVYVLDLGKIISVGPPAVIRQDETVLAAYLDTRHILPDTNDHGEEASPAEQVAWYNDQPGRTRHQLVTALLRAAVETIGQTGPAAMSLREVARRAGVSHAAAAYHFGDKAGLFTAIAAEGYRELGEALQSWCLEKLAYFKAPGWILFVDALPTTGTQKIQKSQIFPRGEDPRRRPSVLDLREGKTRQPGTTAVRP